MGPRRGGGRAARVCAVSAERLGGQPEDLSQPPRASPARDLLKHEGAHGATRGWENKGHPSSSETREPWL